MVNTTLQPRQASIRKNRMVILSVCASSLLWLGGCQSLPPRTSPANAAAKPIEIGKPQIAFLAPGKKTSPPPLPAPTPTLAPPLAQPESTVVVVEKSPQKPILVSTTPTATTRALELPDELPNWRINRVSAREWRVTPRQRPSLSDAPPSLMEDAIISSGLHARLQNVANSSPANWRYSSSAGRVQLVYPSLTCDQALAALRAVVALDKIAEVRLVTTLRAD